MTIKEMRILFAGQTSDEYGTFKGYIGSTNTESNDEESELITTTNSFKDTWDFHYKKKSAPLQFPITLIKSDGTYFDSYEERAIKKWLVKEKREWLQIDQEDLSDIFFYCHLINPRKVDVGGNNAGIQVTCVCDAPWAWSGLRKKTYTTVDGTLTFNFNGMFDFDDYILYPQLIILPTINGITKIKNNTTSEEIIINNCVTTEQILLDCNTDKIQSSSGRIIISDWNKKTISIVEGINSFTLTGNYSLTFQYRLPIRVGG
jgi:hypothetical protein